MNAPVTDIKKKVGSVIGTVFLARSSDNGHHMELVLDGIWNRHNIVERRTYLWIQRYWLSMGMQRLLSLS